MCLISERAFKSRVSEPEKRPPQASSLLGKRHRFMEFRFLENEIKRLL